MQPGADREPAAVDVYKRQEQYRSGLLSQGAQAVMDSAYELSVKSELAARVDCAFLDRRQLKGLPVSYTHLDVYKRQPLHSVGGA